MASPDEMKVAVCEYLLQVNRDDQGPGRERWGPIIPPTAIDWLGDGIVSAILALGGGEDG